jgi:short-subunit dehydrogenase
MSASRSRRTVLITGASAGIGLVSARLFVAEGWNVWAVARSADRLDDLARELGGPPRLVPLPGDVADGDAMAALTSRVLDELGVPDCVVANAGIGLDARFEDTTDEDLRAVFEVNVFGLVRTVRPFVPGMMERGSGRILLISSVLGKRAIPNHAAYAGSKYAIHGFADAMRSELLHSGVSVGVVCPSSTVTEFHDRMKRVGAQPHRHRPRRHTAESVARVIVDMAGSRRREVVLSLEGKTAALLNKFAPGLVDRILARFFLSRE